MSNKSVPAPKQSKSIGLPEELAGYIPSLPTLAERNAAAAAYKLTIPADDPPPAPLTEDDVNTIVAKLSQLKGKDISEICNGYVRQIRAVVTYIKKKLHPRNDEDELVELDRLSRLMGLCSIDEMFIRSKDKIWHARHHIRARDADWFLKRDYSANIKKDHKKAMIETLIRMIQHRYLEMNEIERDQYWCKADEMLSMVERYRKLTGEA